MCVVYDVVFNTNMKSDIKITKIKKPLHVHDVQRKAWRSYRLWRLIGLIILIVAFGVGSYWIIVSSELMRFESLEIVGANQLDEKDIKSFLEYRIPEKKWSSSLLGYSHFWVWPSSWRKEDLKELPHLKQINFKPNYKERKLVAEVKERDFLGIWCNELSGGADCVWFDEEGIAFESSLRPDGYLIFNILDQSTSSRKLGEEVIDKKRFENIGVLEEILRSSDLSYRRLGLTSKRDELFVEVSNGPRLSFSLDFPSRYVADILDSLRRREVFSSLTYVDFRIQNKVFYK